MTVAATVNPAAGGLDAGLRVLLVDDDADDHLIVADLLHSSGGQTFHLVWIPSFEAALDALHSGQYDCGLVDYRLGSRTGLELLAAALRDGCEIPLIVITGFGDDQVALDALRAGAADYLSKDELSSASLARCIRYALERRRTSERMRQVNEKYRKLFEANIIGVAAGRGDQLVDANDAFLDIIGYDPEALHAGTLTWRPLMPPELPSLEDRALGELLEFGVAGPFEQECLRSDGTRIWVRVGMAKLSDRPFEWIAFVENIDVQRRAEESLRSAEELFRSAFDNAPIGMAILHPRGGIVRVNGSFAHILGRTEDDLTGRDLTDFTHPEDVDEARHSIKNALSGRSDTFELKHRYLAADGRSISALLKATLIRDQRGVPLNFVGQLVDLTELERATRRLEEMLRSKDRFIASVSHELRTPLAAVVGYSEILRGEDHRLDPEERAEILQVIASQGRDLSNLIEDLLVAARTEIGDLYVTRVPVDLHAQAAQVLEAWEPSLSERVELSGAAVPALADPTRVRQILRNLISNALRHGGDRARIDVGNGPGQAVVRVIDNGPGISPDERADIFEAYHRAHSVQGTTESIGLGLTISRRLARLMGGDLVYRDQSGESTFELTLPLASGP